MNLQEFISKNKQEASNTLRCGACGNQLYLCGEYEIVKVGLGQGVRAEEGIVCETCQKTERKIENIAKISDDENFVFNVNINQLSLIQKPSVKEVAAKKQQAKESNNDKVVSQSSANNTTAKKEDDKPIQVKDNERAGKESTKES